MAVLVFEAKYFHNAQRVVLDGELVVFDHQILQSVSMTLVSFEKYIMNRKDLPSNKPYRISPSGFESSSSQSASIALAPYPRHELPHVSYSEGAEHCCLSWRSRKGFFSAWYLLSIVQPPCHLLGRLTWTRFSAHPYCCVWSLSNLFAHR